MDWRRLTDQGTRVLAEEPPADTDHVIAAKMATGRPRPLRARRAERLDELNVDRLRELFRVACSFSVSSVDVGYDPGSDLRQVCARRAGCPCRLSKGLGGSVVAMALARRVRPVRPLCGSNELGYR